MKLLEHAGRALPVGGRKLPDKPVATLDLAKHLRAGAMAVPPHPDAVDWTAAAAVPLADLYGNDRLGDCTIAGAYHLLAVWTGNGDGPPFHASLEQVTQAYSDCGGYVPGDPSTDQGCDEVTVLEYFTKGKGFADGSRAAAWCAIDATNPELVMACVWLFEGLYLGLILRRAYINPFPGPGAVWDVSDPCDPNDGHCVIGDGYDRCKGLRINTWGIPVWLTWRALGVYCSPEAGGRCYVLLHPEVISRAKQKAPNLFDWDALLAEIEALSVGATEADVPPPAEAKAPEPPPTIDLPEDDGDPPGPPPPTAPDAAADSQADPIAADAAYQADKAAAGGLVAEIEQAAAEHKAIAESTPTPVPPTDPEPASG